MSQSARIPGCHMKLDYTLQQQWMPHIAQMIERRAHLDDQLQYILRLAGVLQEAYC